jgi:hypothetical protein
MSKCVPFDNSSAAIALCGLNTIWLRKQNNRNINDSKVISDKKFFVVVFLAIISNYPEISLL